MRLIKLLFAPILFGVTFLIAPAHAQVRTQVVASCPTSTTLYTTHSTNPALVMDVHGTLCTAASVSASIAGFTPDPGAPATLTATGSSSASTALPTGTVVLAQNTGTTTVSCVFVAGAATATTHKLQIPASSTVAITVGTADHAACIDESGSVSNLVVLIGGDGIPTGWGGGGGGSGGAVTMASAAVSSGAYASGSIASGAFASGALASGSVASGAMVDLGAQADAACSTDNGSCSLVALTKRTNQDLTTLNTSVTSAVPAGTNLIGKVGIDQTTMGTTNGVVNAANAYETVAASQTAQAMGATGATGDYLSHCIVTPGTTSPGVVTILDNATAIVSFAGGASSVSNLVPFAIPIGAISVSGAWKITTGANVTVVCVGKFT